MVKIQKLLYAALALSFLVIGFQIYEWWQSKSKLHERQSATILLEHIQKVAKLTTVEGSFSEIYEKSSFKYFDISPFQKKVLVRVKAKVSAGYDFNQMSIEVDSTSKSIWINALPEPQILSIDHDLDYYDVSEGLFTSLDRTDYNQIQIDAKELIRKKALESNLLAEAQAQGNDFMDMIKFIVESSGWQLKFRARPALKQ
ncbi:MAG: DUF4230 domain-containing protein [Saprospiraceae bacterium]